MRMERAAVALLMGLGVVGTAQAASPLAAHRAVYEIELADASDRSGITGMDGRMVYDFGGSACDGYTVNFRFVTRIATAETSRVTDQQTTTFENVSERMFQFATRSFIDERQDREVKGTASADAVELTEPEERSIELDEAAFPTQHMIEMLEAARAGESLFERNLFDGSDDADAVLATTAVIGKAKEGEDDGNEAAEPLNGMRYWPVTVAYYADADKEGEALPLYRIEMDLFENGIARELEMDYGDFRISGTLSQLDIRPIDEC